MTITLTDREMRYAHARALDVERISRGKKTMELTSDTGYKGYIGELAVKHYLGESMEIPVNPIGGDPGYDIDWEGYKIDVKWSVKGALLMICNDIWKPGKCDILFAVSQGKELRDVHFDGWILEDDFVQVAVTGRKGLTPKCRSIEVSKLNQIGTWGLRDQLKELEIKPTPKKRLPKESLFA